jgi:hypothetical protein
MPAAPPSGLGRGRLSGTTGVRSVYERKGLSGRGALTPSALMLQLWWRPGPLGSGTSVGRWPRRPTNAVAGAGRVLGPGHAASGEFSAPAVGRRRRAARCVVPRSGRDPEGTDANPVPARQLVTVRGRCGDPGRRSGRMAPFDRSVRPSAQSTMTQVQNITGGATFHRVIATGAPPRPSGGPRPSIPGAGPPGIVILNHGIERGQGRCRQW